MHLGGPVFVVCEGMYHPRWLWNVVQFSVSVVGLYAGR